MPYKTDGFQLFLGTTRRVHVPLITIPKDDTKPVCA